MKGILYLNLIDHPDLNTYFLLPLQDMTEKLKFLWGSCNDGNMLVSDDAAVLKADCGKSFAPFPKGMLIISSLEVDCVGLSD